MTRPRPIDHDDPLFDYAARNTDPVTSHLAAEETKASRAHQCALLLSLIVAEPGRTAGEYAEKSGVVGSWKRVSDLARRGLVRYEGRVESPLTGRMCQRVWPA